MRVLLVNLCDLGDLLFSSPLIEALGAAHEVHYLADQSCADAIAGHPNLARCWILPRRDWAARLALPDGRQGALAEALAWAASLAEQDFDAVYCLQPRPLAATLAALARGREQRGFTLRDGALSAGEGCDVLLRHLLRFENRADDGLHAAEGYLSLLPAGLRPAAARLSFGIPAPARGRAEALAPGPPRAQRLAALPGAGDASKRWGLDAWRGLLKGWLRLHPGGEVLVLGGAEDRVRGEALARGQARIRSLCGGLSLAESAALLRRCSVAVGGDTGPLHLAAAVGTPCLGLFGPTHPAESGPLLSGSLAVKASSGCMDDLEPAAVLRALAALQQGALPLGLRGAECWPCREAEGRRVDAAWEAASGPAWLARQLRVEGAVPVRALSESLAERSWQGQLKLEGSAQALVHAQLCAAVKVFADELP